MKNNIQQKKAKNDDFKPRKWLLYLLIIINIVIVVILINKVVTDRKNKVEDKPNNGIFDIFQKLEDMNSNSDFEKHSFNSSFELYVGTEWGVSVSRLIDEITTNNKTNQDRMITVVFDEVNTTDVDEIRNIKKSLDDWTEYEVILDYDSDGFVNLITIEK